MITCTDRDSRNTPYLDDLDARCGRPARFIATATWFDEPKHLCQYHVRSWRRAIGVTISRLPQEPEQTA